MPVVEMDQGKKVRFASSTRFKQRKWSRDDESRQKFDKVPDDPNHVKSTEGYVSDKLHKRGIKVREHLAVMRAKLWNRDAYDRGGNLYLQELHAGAWCQAGLVGDDDDGQMECNFMGIE